MGAFAILVAIIGYDQKFLDLISTDCACSPL